MSHADIWVGHPEIPSIDLGRPIPEDWKSYVWCEAGCRALRDLPRRVQQLGQTDRRQRTGPGHRHPLAEPDPLGAIDLLTPEHRVLLSEPGAVVVDVGEFGRLGITKVGDTAEVNGHEVRVVGTVNESPQSGRSVSVLFRRYGPVACCPAMADQTTFILARCYNKEDAPEIVARLKEKYPAKISAFTSEAFSLHSRMHWLTKTRAGIALGLAACLGLLVGAVVTSQTLYAATAASMKEYAVLRALGIPAGAWP